jgi:hypothetical protein
MTDIKQLHRKAMSERDSALSARLAGNDQDALRHFQAAYRLESEAANELTDRRAAEPARSILFRSAATIAKECGLLEEAQKLIYKALSGDPPPDIKMELQDLLEEVNFTRHLELRDVSLSPDELQMALTGRDVGFGIAPADVLISRLQSTENLLVRIAERRLARPYRDHGRRDSSLGHFFISVPRAACLAVTFRMGSLQPSLPTLSGGEEVIDDFLTCLDLFNREDTNELRALIPDDAYFANFVGLARNLQPDGTKVNMVGFTAIRAGKPRQVALRKARGDAPGLPGIDITLESSQTSGVSSQQEIVRGELQFADITSRRGKQSNEIKIVAGGNLRFTVVVPPGMMDDIVKPLWASEVEVSGVRKGNKIYLSDIRAMPSEDGS